jgi:hypothetical protein
MRDNSGNCPKSEEPLATDLSQIIRESAFLLQIKIRLLYLQARH